MAISFNGYKDQVITFESSNATENYPVKISANGKVANCAAGNDFIGVAVNVRGDAVGVQTDGYIEMSYSSTAPALGFTGLVADGSGGVKASTSSAVKYKVITVNETSSTVGFIL